MQRDKTGIFFDDFLRILLLSSSIGVKKNGFRCCGKKSYNSCKVGKSRFSPQMKPD
jgi:hypothetical protein